MKKTKIHYNLVSPFKLVFFSAVFLAFLASCNDSQVDVTDKEIVETPEQINARAEDVIQGTLKEVLGNNGKLGDSFQIRNPGIVQFLYEDNSYRPLWSSKGSFTRNGDSLFSIIHTAKLYGLFPEDYYLLKLETLRTQLIADTSSREKK